MRKLYGVITPGGTASDDAGEDTENCQWLGKYEAETHEEAANKCREQLAEWGQHFDELYVYELKDNNPHFTYGVYKEEN